VPIVKAPTEAVSKVMLLMFSVVPPTRLGLRVIVGFPPLILKVAVSPFVVVSTAPGNMWFPVLQFWLPPVCEGIQLLFCVPFHVAEPAASAELNETAVNARASAAKTQLALRRERLRLHGIAEMRLIFVYKFYAVPRAVWRLCKPSSFITSFFLRFCRNFTDGA
jgi:hypothetical protein